MDIVRRVEMEDVNKYEMRGEDVVVMENKLKNIGGAVGSVGLIGNREPDFADTAASTVKEEDLAALLLSVADIANKEVDNMMSERDHLWSSCSEKDDDESEEDDDDVELPPFPSLTFRKKKDSYVCSISPRVRTLSMEEDDDDQDEKPHPRNSSSRTSVRPVPNRVRTVSIDAPMSSTLSSPRASSPVTTSTGLPTATAIVSPTTSPIHRGVRGVGGGVPSSIPLRKSTRSCSTSSRRGVVVSTASTATTLGSSPRATDMHHKRRDHSIHREDEKQPRSPSSAKTVKSGRSVQPRGAVARSAIHPLKTILRKKFSWKNYPELEAFLIANREEYLRHSALNYTIQQKQYNNRLTERLLELAADHGYVFDEHEFSFVTVRDRIRCYFKSYVQSAKKRGVIIGYAARKAGLLTEDDLEKSAAEEGRIVVPSEATESSSTLS